MQTLCIKKKHLEALLPCRYIILYSLIIRGNNISSSRGIQVNWGIKLNHVLSLPFCSPLTLSDADAHIIIQPQVAALAIQLSIPFAKLRIRYVVMLFDASARVARLDQVKLLTARDSPRLCSVAWETAGRLLIRGGAAHCHALVVTGDEVGAVGLWGVCQDEAIPKVFYQLQYSP